MHDMRRTSTHLVGTYPLVAILGVATLLLFGCGPKRSNSVQSVDPDGDMGTANGLFFDMEPVDDRINPAGGDREDWRYIIVPAEGTMSVTLNVDNPSITGTWYLLDTEGRAVHTEMINATRSFYELPNRPVLPGRYHFRLQAQEGSSVYSLGATFEPSPERVVEVEEEVVEEEVDDEPQESRRHRTRRTRSARTESKPKVEAEDAETTSTGSREITGTITRATERDDGSVSVVIRGVGTSAGVSDGMKGKVKGLGVKVKTEGCSSKKCNGVVDSGATARDLREHDQVVFTVK